MTRFGLSFVFLDLDTFGLTMSVSSQLRLNYRYLGLINLQRIVGGDDETVNYVTNTIWQLRHNTCS